MKSSKNGDDVAANKVDAELEEESPPHNMLTDWCPEQSPKTHPTSGAPNIRCHRACATDVDDGQNGKWNRRSWRSLPRSHESLNFIQSSSSSRNSQDTSAIQQNNQVECGAAGGYNWQATKMTVKERFAFMFNNELLADVWFVVGRNMQRQRIPAHRFVLAVGSAVFDAMFNGTLATNATDIELPDVEPAAFLALLKSLYSDEVQIGPETVMTTLYTAKKYAVPSLEKHCVEYLKSNVSPDNAFLLLTQARIFDEPQLAALCLQTIDKCTLEAVQADCFNDIDRDTLLLVLDRDTLRIHEAKLFHAVIRWSEAECGRQELDVTPENQRRVLGRAVSLVRFPLIPVEEFAGHAAQSGLLTDQEVVSLFLYYHVNPKPAIAFKDTPRMIIGKEQCVRRFNQIEMRWGYSGTSDRIRFTTDRRIFVLGFGLYGSVHGPTEYGVTVQLLKAASGKVCASHATTFTCDGSNSTFRALFEEPVEIQANVCYLACATLKGPDSHYGTKGVRKVCVECPNKGKVTFQFSYAAGNNNGTSVEDGQIPEILFYV
ncbi:BTB/POZ domain-containing protein 1 [Nilaparvata lugens]|uniref:BTB/POZ domain-containing protein 1 n=1 Tax=Nilaparvata lugens TaxID=108931 RepID=UPI000B990C26|nr:BTB/POZ domain-containing protein 1 [Nilaparvata lugens]XP_039291826.1 BTB/POZ domain-containing protein 1 [Nilaparvata lugens]